MRLLDLRGRFARIAITPVAGSESGSGQRFQYHPPGSADGTVGTHKKEADTRRTDTLKAQRAATAAAKALGSGVAGRVWGLSPERCQPGTTNNRLASSPAPGPG